MDFDEDKSTNFEDISSKNTIFEDMKMIKISRMPTIPISILCREILPDISLLNQENFLESYSFDKGLL